MQPIEKAFQWVLEQPDILSALMLVDNYMQTAVKLEKLLLPAAHAPLQPLIAKYAIDLAGFRKFIRDQRDNFKRGDREYRDLHEFYRTLDVRLQQQTRRARINRWAEAAVPFETPAHRDSAMLAQEQEWTRRRLDYLELARSRHPKKRLSTTERAMVADEFWAGVDKEIENLLQTR